MTRTPSAARPFVALLATLVAAPLAAQAPTVVAGTNRPIFQERVSTADLDLSNWLARQRLQVRVHRASERVCAQAEGLFFANIGGFKGTPSCTDLTFEAARPQIAAAIDRARSGQPTTAWNIAVAAQRTR